MLNPFYGGAGLKPALERDHSCARGISYPLASTRVFVFQRFRDSRVGMRPSNFEASTRVLLGEIRSDVESGMQATLQASIFWLALQAK